MALGCTRQQDSTFIERLIRKTKYCASKKQMTQMLVPMSKCPDSGVGGLDQESKAVSDLLNGFKEKDPGLCYHL